MMNNEYKIVNFGDLKPGDKLIGTDGELTEVTDVYQKHIPNKMFEIQMEDGEVIQASGNHLWYCETDGDLNNKENYKRLAKEFFENYDIPSKKSGKPYYSLHEMISMFEKDNIKTQMFIEQTCRSLGYSSVTPHIIIEDLKKVSNVEIHNYDYNDLIDFLHKMKKAVIYNEGYFYFGEVRTTEEIAKLINHYNVNVNIPHQNEIKSDDTLTKKEDKNEI